MKIKAGIIGAAGYTGYELIKILQKHQKIELAVLNSRTYANKAVKSVYKDFSDPELKFTDIPIEDFKVDVVFLAVPNGAAMDIVPKLKCKVVDLSADYRFEDSKIYEKVYNTKHTDNETKAVYGLPELFEEEIKKAKLVANPGCYATASILAALPIQKYSENIIFDCKSGYSGAGVKKTYVNDPINYSNNIIPYKITKHRHKYEIQQFLKNKISFTPHVIPVFRGLMCTMHAFLNKKMDSNQIKNIYENYYKNKPFVKIVEKIPELHDVQNNNHCCLHGEVDENNQLVIVSVIDNLLKGASGQAVQNMNLMFGFEETEGLK
jgi:N-acetyl-gamma-glutamyl-phosphate reductase|tara:strand:- start:113 stop:1075 length:963 start_codon:yes stop_codon:yes gene_type:complete